MNDTKHVASVEVRPSGARWKSLAFLALAAGTLLAGACSIEAGTEDTSGGATDEEVDQRELEVSSPVTVKFQNGSAPSASYAGTDDATLRQGGAATNYGGATTCEMDGDDAGSDKSCLVKWALAGIPAGSTVQSASLTFRVLNATVNTYTIYDGLRAWNESQVTWNNAATSSPWATSGARGSADRGPSVGTITGATGSRTVTLNSAGISMVQRWVNGGTNAGVILASASSTDGLDIASSENGTVSYRPALAVTYLPPDTGTGGATNTEANLLVAFIGDQGANSNSDAVLNLIKSEGAAAVVHNGDFDYASNPTAWDNRINNILGSKFPYFAVIGNHDAPAWDGSSGYGAKIAARIARVPEMQCTGKPGVQADCRFRGLHLVQSCVGTDEYTGASCGKDSATQVDYIKSSLASSNAVWDVCNWHKNQNDMQLGTKSDEVGWNAYRACQAAGAMVSTGHEHSYGRTLTLTDLGSASNGHGKTGQYDNLQLGAGRTFVFVSGLAGVGVRDVDSSHNNDTWWSAQYGSNRWMKSGVVKSGTGTYGALFINFHVDGNPKKAYAYFKDVNGRIVDAFTIWAP